MGLALAIVAGCSGDGVTDPTGEGTVTGKVTAADGITPVALASVYVEAKGLGSAVISETDGSYTLTAVPAGSQVIVAVKGNFRSETTVNVAAGTTTTAPAAMLEPQGKLGYVAGFYDSIEDIITNMEYPIEPISQSSLSSATVLNQYKMIFLNCGAGVSVDASVVNALKAWVQAGGTLYASDWELDVIQAMFPQHILAVGSGDSQTITASVTSSDLQEYTGKSSASIAYDLGAWKMLLEISSTPTVLLRGNVTGYNDTDFEPTSFQNQALAITFTHGQGRVVYTTFHNEAGVTTDQLAVLRYFIHY